MVTGTGGMDSDASDDDTAGKASKVPSLQQLKALGSLPDLDTKLDTVTRLCNDGSTAEMILKWLLPEIQNNCTARAEPKAWNVFASCLRLIPLRKLGPQLSRFDLGIVLQQVADDQTKPVDNKSVATCSVLHPVADFLKLALEISSQPDGASLRGAVSFAAEKAAKILGAWVRCILESEDRDNLEDQGLIGILSPAFSIWDHRRTGVDDNKAFFDHCLAPLTALLGCSGSSHVEQASSKRKLGNNTTRNGGYRVLTERLFARHVFLASRKKYLSGQTSTHEAGSGSMDMEPLKVFIDSNPALLDQTCAAVPQLLEIALRCINLSTTRQRAQERPWIEHIFSRLVACVTSDQHLMRPQSVYAMLEIIKKRASLSPAFLKQLVQTYSELEAGTSDALRVDLELIARVIAVDANVFVEEDYAESLFDELTRRHLDQPRVTEHKKEVLIEGITVPLVKAFASSRKLEVFFQQWFKHLSGAEDHGHRTVWTKINTTVAELVEDHLTTSQIEALLDKYAPNKKADRDHDLQCKVVILHAILTGIKSDDLCYKFYQTAETIFDRLCKTLSHSASGKASSSDFALAGHRHFWLILSASFQLWFPRWAAGQESASVVSAKARLILSSPALDSLALSFPKHGGSSDPERQSSSAAELFIGQLVAHLHGYEGCQEHASKIIRRLCTDSVHVISPALVAYPELLDHADADLKLLFTKALHSASGADTTAEMDNMESSLFTVVTFAMDSKDTHYRDQLVAAVTENPRNIKSEDGLFRYAALVLQCIASIEPAKLTRDQRLKVLNYLTMEAGLVRKHCNVEQLLAVLVHLMDVTNPDADISNDAAFLWTLADSTALKGAEDWDASALALLQEFTRLLLSHLLPTHDQARSHKALESFFRSNLVEIDSCVENKSVDHIGRLTVIKTISKMLYPMQAKLNGDGTASKGISRFIELLLKQCKKQWKHFPSNGDTSQADLKLGVMLDVLDTFESLGLAEGVALQDLMTIITKSTEQMGKAPKALVQAYKILSRTTRDASLGVARKALAAESLGMPAREMILSMVSSESDAGADASTKRLLHIGSSLSSEDLLLLHRRLVGINKDTFAADDQRTGHLLVSGLLSILQEPADFATRTGAISCLLTIVRDKPFLINQNLVETTLTTIHDLAAFTTTASSPIYLDLCALLTALLTHHRARLQNRFHLVIAVLQSLLARLFTPNKTSNSSAAKRKALSSRHARTYTRLLTLLCNPPTHHYTSKRASSGTSELVDSARRARAHVGQYAPYLLHSFCSQLLTGTLGEGMREALTPGLWALVESMEVRSPDAVKALSSAMNNSERAVLRGVYDEWRRFGKWEGA